MGLSRLIQNSESVRALPPISVISIGWIRMTISVKSSSSNGFLLVPKMPLDIPCFSVGGIPMTSRVVHVFDPNSPEADPDYRWASYSDTRKRDRGFKQHSDFAKMRAAINNCHVIRCFERVGGIWVEIYAHAWKKGGETLL